MEMPAADFLFQMQAHSEGGLHISVWDEQALATLTRSQLVQMGAVVDTFGRMSATAQGLSGPVTDLARMRSNGHVLYLAAAAKSGDRMQVLGGLKIGQKRLFLHSPRCHKYLEMNPNCVLDFYVHESCQRSGIGRRLLETYLQDAGQTAAMLAYDRPSPKLKAFLAKHYGLASFTPQHNNYVVFNELLEAAESAAKRKLSPRSVLTMKARTGSLLQPSTSEVPVGGRAASSPAAIRCPAPQPAAPQPPGQRTAMPAAQQAAPLGGGAAGAAVPVWQVQLQRQQQQQQQQPVQTQPQAQAQAAVPVQQFPLRLPQPTALPTLLAPRAQAAPSQPTTVYQPAAAQPATAAPPCPPATRQQASPPSHSAAVNAAALASQQLWEAALRQARTPPAPPRRPSTPAAQRALLSAAHPIAATSRTPPTMARTPPGHGTPRRSSSSGEATPILRTPWALHIAEDMAQGTTPSRLLPARKSDISMRSKAAALPQFQLTGSVASR